MSLTPTAVGQPGFDDAFGRAPTAMVALDAVGSPIASNSVARRLLGEDGLLRLADALVGRVLRSGPIDFESGLAGVRSLAHLVPQPDGWLLLLAPEADTSDRGQDASLPDRTALIDDIGRRLVDVGPNIRFGVASIGLGHLDSLTDSLGHGNLDSLVERVAVELAEVLADNPDTEPFIARLAAAEIGVVLNAGSTVELLDRLEAALPELVDRMATSSHLQPVAGLTTASKPDTAPDELLRNAIEARRHAQRHDVVVQLFHDGIGRAARATRVAQARLGASEVLDQILVHYQPVIDLQHGRTVGAEALVRWLHPTEGLLGPASFIEAAEATGHIVAIGARVLEVACRDLASWREAGIVDEGFTVGVNVAPVQLDRRELVVDVERLLRLHDLPAASLCLEVTESALLSNRAVVIDNAERLRNLGIKIAIDDFGTGYSSLARLRGLPVTTLKLDRAFVADLDRDDAALTVAAGVLTLARGLALEVVAEGAEREGQALLLKEYGCDRGQGFYWSEPLTADVFAEWLRSHDSAAATPTPAA